MQELAQLTWVFSRSFLMPCASFAMLDGPRTVKHWKWCKWHWKASAKSSSKLSKFLHREVNLLIQHIIAQDQDGQNNNILFFSELTCVQSVRNHSGPQGFASHGRSVSGFSALGQFMSSATRYWPRRNVAQITSLVWRPWPQPEEHCKQFIT